MTGYGLSPRLRGNRLFHIEKGLLNRSIPAPAGEPGESGAEKLDTAVYPRACGGTRFPEPIPWQSPGLSPRLRGNPFELRTGTTPPRSIPAPAGEPSTRTRPPYPMPVYPRACGGTCHHPHGRDHDQGLSPRLRGNLLPPYPQPTETRSIPAPAGEPPRPGGSTWYSTVYPRACGGTSTPTEQACPASGLSPRLRGNLKTRHSPYLLSRSIPAPAGEPLGADQQATGVAVYPRACGGTSVTEGAPGTPVGLSPRLRGNLAALASSLALARSIPAPAGEPLVTS